MEVKVEATIDNNIVNEEGIIGEVKIYFQRNVDDQKIYLVQAEEVIGVIDLECNYSQCEGFVDTIKVRSV